MTPGTQQWITLRHVLRGLALLQTGLARGLLTNENDRARPLVAEAVEQNRETLAELRAVSRGIAPAIL